jgi:hypothetical protein
MNWDAKPFQLYIHQNAEVIVGKSIQTNPLTFTIVKTKFFNHGFKNTVPRIKPLLNYLIKQKKREKIERSNRREIEP